MKVFAKRPADISAKATDDYGRLVLKVAYRIVPNSDQAQESFQDTFFRFHASCTRGELITYPKAWLCRVATNVAFNARPRQPICPSTSAPSWPCAEIAAQLGCNAASARFSKYKALKKMRAWRGND